MKNKQTYMAINYKRNWLSIGMVMLLLMAFILYAVGMAVLIQSNAASDKLASHDGYSVPVNYK